MSLNSLPWQILERLRWSRDNAFEQSWVYDPSDIKTLEVVRSFRFRGVVYLGSKNAADGRGDRLELPGPEAKELLKEGNCIIVSGGQANRVIFPNSKTRTGYVPWENFTTAGIVLDPEFDDVFLPVKLNRTAQIVAGLILPAGAMFQLQFGWIRRAGFDLPNKRFAQKFAILSEREEEAAAQETASRS
jgi:hypothetical protein